MSAIENDALKRAALKAISEQSGLKHPVLVHSAEDVVPSSGKKIFRFSATEKDKGNSPAASVVLDESGAPVEFAKLAASETKTFFAPAIGAVRDDLLDPIKVRIDPPRNDLTLKECDKFSETVTVFIPNTAALAKADIYFLADTTDSMEPILSAVRTGASAILGGLTGFDFAFGVGNYKDFPNDPYAFQPQQAVTKSLPAVQAAINTWTNSGGNDIPEGQFFALNQIAEPPGGSIGWRSDSKRIIVWFGDAPGHDPICGKISGLPFDITEASVTAKLVSEKISAIAISTTTGTPGALDADPVPLSTDYNSACGAPGGSAGQATNIAAATGGIHVTGIDATTIVQTIIDLVKKVLGPINNVSLVPDAVVAPFVESIVPAGGYGPLPRDEDHTLKFDVTFSSDHLDCATRDRVFVGSLDVVVDGAIVGRKPMRITVPACKYTYSVKFVCGVQEDCDCNCSPVRPGSYATEINIHNFKCHEASIEKHLIPLVFAGAAAGRDPRASGRRVSERVKLPSDTATMIDCCRITELLLGAAPTGSTALSVGIIEIVSDVELNVTAVYTASDLKSGSLTMDVQTITPRLK